jgi:hypothetical protein
MAEATALVKTGRLVVHHGMCIGVDAEAHQLILRLRKDEKLKIDIIGHPSDMHTTTAKLTGFTKVCQPKPPLDRNHDVVENSDILLAFPFEKEDVLRSGTWATVRYAKRCRVPILLVFPDGDMKWVAGK